MARGTVVPHQEEQAVPMFCCPTSIMRVKQIWGVRVRTTIMILAQRALIFFPFFILYQLNCFHLWGQWVALIVNIISTIQTQWFFSLWRNPFVPWGLVALVSSETIEYVRLYWQDKHSRFGVLEVRASCTFSKGGGFYDLYQHQIFYIGIY